MVALENLKATCARVSSMCQRFSVVSVAATRVGVAYSNPAEYGSEHPMVAVFSCYPSAWHEDAENPRVLLEIMRVLYDNWDGEGWQLFQPLLNCPTLWRNSDGVWQGHKDIQAAGARNCQRQHATCTVCDLPREE